MNENWLRQSLNKPLFSDLLWSRPENRRLAGKLVVVGGNAHGFSMPVHAYSESLRAGAGVVNVLLPSSTQKMVGHIFSDVTFAASTISGGFSKDSLGEFMILSDWADGVFLAGEIGNNSETTILIEEFLDNYDGPLVVTNDVVDMVSGLDDKILNRNKTVIVTGIGKLQKLTQKIRLPFPIKYSIPMVNLVESLKELTAYKEVALVIEKENTIFVAYKGRVSTTPYNKPPENWQTILASHASVWTIQNNTKIFEALSCAALTAQS